MARDGSGTYQLPAGQPVVTATPISSTVFNTFTSDVANSLTQSLSKDGQTTPTADLPMGGNKHTGVADGSARTHYATVGQLQDLGVLLAGSVAGVDTITASLTPAITGYVNYRPVCFLPAGPNVTTTVTLSLNGLTAKSILKEGNVALVAGDLATGVPALVLYSGTAWVLINPQKRTNTTITGLGTLSTQSGTLSSYGATLIDDADAATARTTLGLGTLATQSGTLSGYGATLIDDADAATARTTLGLGSIATINSTAYVNTILDDTDAATARGTLGLGTLSTQSGTFSGTHSGASSGTNTGDQTITLTGDVTGTGTGSFATTLAASTILTKLLTVDGSGSGLDADLLDGSSSAAFATASHNHAASEITSGTFADARIASTNVTQFQTSIKGKNLTGKSGVSFTIQSGGTASGGADGDIIGIY